MPQPVGRLFVHAHQVESAENEVRLGGQDGEGVIVESPLALLVLRRAAQEVPRPEIPLGDKPQPLVAAAPAPVDDCSTRDSDGDGVNDCDDKCPGTMKGAKVDEYGCLVRIELRGVNFHYDSAELTESAKAILDEVSAGLIASDEKKDIEVQGHTSTEGTDQYNMRLSQRRAASVVDYLKLKGVTNNLYPKGYGESYPKVSPDRTEAERAVNRRVELVWMGD